MIVLSVNKFRANIKEFVGLAMNEHHAIWLNR